MNIAYAWQRCIDAVSCLAGSSDTIQQRLINCGVTLLPLIIEDFPDNLKTDFEEIQEEFTSVEPVHNEGSIEASVRAMSEEKAEALASKIVSMSITIIMMYGATDEGREIASS